MSFPIVARLLLALALYSTLSPGQFRPRRDPRERRVETEPNRRPSEERRPTEDRRPSEERRSEEKSDRFMADNVSGRRVQGRLFEMNVRQEYRDRGYEVYEQVTVRTESGNRMRPDLIVRDKAGNYSIVEVKAMEDRRPQDRRSDFRTDSRLTENQKQGFSEITEGKRKVQVMGEGKGLPREIEIRRIEVVGESSRNVYDAKPQN